MPFVTPVKKRAELRKETQVPADLPLDVKKFNMNMGVGFKCGICGMKHRAANMVSVSRCQEKLSEELHNDVHGVLLEKGFYTNSFGQSFSYKDSDSFENIAWSIFWTASGIDCSSKKSMRLIDRSSIKGETLNQDSLKYLMAIPDRKERAVEFVNYLSQTFKDKIKEVDDIRAKNNAFTLTIVSRLKDVGIKPKPLEPETSKNDRYRPMLLNGNEFESREIIRAVTRLFHAEDEYLMELIWVNETKNFYSLSKNNSATRESAAILQKIEANKLYYPRIVNYHITIKEAIKQCEGGWIEYAGM